MMFRSTLAVFTVSICLVFGLISDVDISSFTTGSAGSKLIGSVTNAMLGDRADTAGDFNRDGFDDVIVGSPGSSAFATFVVFGRSSGFSFDASTFTSGTNGFKITGSGSASYAGDINGDGYGDIVTGDVFADYSGRTDCGAAYVLFGHAGPFYEVSGPGFTTSDTMGFKVYGAMALSHVGGSVGSAGDINGDGFDDLFLAAVGGNRGRGYVIFGRRSGFADIDLASLISTGDSRGFHIICANSDWRVDSASTVGDFNHDGYSDIYFGCPWDDNAYGVDAGAAYTIFGHSNATAFPELDLSTFTSGTAGFKMTGAYADDKFGLYGAYAGDFNGDGVDDMIHGSWRSQASGRSMAGKAYVMFGDRYTTSFPALNMRDFVSGNKGFMVLGGAATDYFGSSMRYAGDMNGDGMDDIIIGAFHASPLGRSDAGAAYVIYGRTSASGPYITIDMASFTTGALGFKIFGAATGDLLGITAGYAGDVNGDGTDDIFAGASKNDPLGRSNAGAFYVIHGTGPPTTAPSTNPSALPTIVPSTWPTFSPTLSPTTRPTTVEPTPVPTSPTSQPSAQPSSQPSAQPSSQPSVNPAVLEKILSSRTYQVHNGYAFAALTPTGSVHTWGEAANGGDSLQVQHLLSQNVTQVVGSRYSYVALVGNTNGSVVVPWGVADHSVGFNAFPSGSYSLSTLISNEAAFAGIDQETGRVVAFGSHIHGGNVLDDSKCNGYSNALSSGVVSIAASAGSFAAIKADGSVYTWGNKHTGADVSSTFLASIVGVRLVVATRAAFAVLLQSGRVVAWGDPLSGGDTSAVAPQLLHDVVHLSASKSTFAAFKKDSSLVAWGNGPWGGDTSAVAHELTVNVTFLAHTFTAMAVLKKDGRLLAWGKADGGGDSSAVQSQLVDVVDVWGNSKAFAALTAAGRVVAWGKAAYGGQIPSNKVSALSSGVVSIHHTNRAFAALKSDGSVVVWGQAGHGGSPGAAVEAHLVSGVHTICSNDAAFSVIKEDGSVVGWGHTVSIPTAGLLFSAAELSSPVQCI